jgi:hypothetical protein
VNDVLDVFPRVSDEVQVTRVSPMGNTPDFEHVTGRDPSTASVAAIGP